MIEVRLYGKLRRFAPQKAVDANSVLLLPAQPNETIGSVLRRGGIDAKDTSHLFLNGELSALTRKVSDGDRLGVFPDDMSVLYKWYFAKKT